MSSETHSLFFVDADGGGDGWSMWVVAKDYADAEKRWTARVRDEINCAPDPPKAVHLICSPDELLR